jgi:hypothetical protein
MVIDFSTSHLFRIVGSSPFSKGKDGTAVSDALFCHICGERDLHERVARTNSSLWPMLVFLTIYRPCPQDPISLWPAINCQ